MSAQSSRKKPSETASSDSQRSRGRPAKGPGLVDGLSGSEQAKLRLRVVLETVAGQRTVEEACTALGLSRSGFNKLRGQVLQAALGELEPKVRGRPPKEPSAEADAAELAALREEHEKALDELMIANVREELRLVFPDLVEPDDPEERKKKAQRLKNRRKRQRKQQW